jgi:lysine 2,3-aminomutase
MEALGEEPEEYKDVWGYSIGETESISPLYIYPDYDYSLTDKMTNLELARNKES